jgi:2-succinyl-5-enolpyruvyl-6-hydroxy-3-cyclohexene-1-carboxylate synthase
MDATNRNTALCSALVDELARAGVEHACVSPGSRSAPIALAFWNEPRIKVWSIVDERSAGFFALGIAQQTGKPATIVTTSGTAGANVHPAVAEASHARVPLIVITADRPPELRDRGAGQTIDQIKLYGSAVRWFCELGNIDADDEGLLHFRSAGSRAVAEAEGAMPGPIHLNLPLREPLAPQSAPYEVSAERELAREGRPAGLPLTTIERPPPAPDASLVDELVRMIHAHPRGVILAGRQRGRDLAASACALSAACGYPILAEPTSQLRAGDHDLDRVVAPYDPIFRSLPERLAPDLVIRLGDMVTSKAVRLWLAGHDECRQIVIDADGAWNEPTWTAESIVRADAAALCRLAADGCELPNQGWAADWKQAAGAAEAAADDFFATLGDELFEPRVHRMLGDLLPARTTVYVASSMPVRDLESFFPATGKQLRFLANRGANGIDGLISSGLGAAATSGEHTLVISGDVGLYHDMNGLLAIKRSGIAATILVMNNGGGSIFDFLPIARHREGFEQLFSTPTGLDLERVASLYELDFTRIGGYDDLEQALAKPGLVEVPLDRSRNVMLHHELFERISKAVAAIE